MTQADRAQLEKDVLYDVVTAQRECNDYRVKLARTADALAELARGLRDCPELVTPLPEVNTPDYREGLNLLNSRAEVIGLCDSLREAKEKLRRREGRKADLGF
jgi:hypothetical protein